METNALNFADICRCCKRGEPEMTSIFAENPDPPQLRTAEMLMDIGCFKIQQNDGLPFHICNTCKTTAQSAYDFRQQLIKNEAELWKILAQQRTSTEDTSEDPLTDDVGIFLRSLLSKSNEVEQDEAFENATMDITTSDTQHNNSSVPQLSLYQCKLCNCYIPTLKNEDLLSHMQLHVKRLHRGQENSTKDSLTLFNLSKLTCNTCHEPFTEPHKHNLHVKLHEHLESENFNDFLVFFTKFDNFTSSDKQISSENKIEYECLYCDEKCSSFIEIKRHMIKHLEFAPCKCTKCNCIIFTCKELFEHMDKCDGELNWYCATCSKAFDHLDRLNFHMKNDPTCGNYEKALYEDELQDTRIRKYYKCTDDVIMSNEINFRGRAPSDNDREYSCVLCNHCVATYDEIKEHMLVHLYFYPCKCTKCSCAILTCGEFYQHMRQCDGKLLWYCVTCADALNDVFGLNLHRDYECKLRRYEKRVTLDEIQDDVLFHLYSTNETEEMSEEENEGEENEDQESETQDQSKRKLFACKLCDVTCSHFKHMKRHLFSHLKDKPFKCEKCRRAFSRNDKLSQHSLVCDGGAKGIREEENDGCSTLELNDLLDCEKINEYYTEISCNSDKNENRLEVCDVKEVLSLDETRKHVEQEDDDDIVMTIKIQIDDADDENVADSSDGDYVPNANRKKGRAKKRKGRGVARGPGRPRKTKDEASCKSERSKKFRCLVCDETFDRIAMLESHGKEYHADSKVLKCAQCEARFSRVYALNRHAQEHNTEEDSIDRNAKQREEDAQDGKKRKEHECEKCLKRFTTLKAKSHHMKKHDDGDVLVCPKCSKPFLSKSNLTEHMKFHNKTKKFLCSECGQGFIRNDYLIVHMRRHRGEKPFACKFCGKGFPRVTDLKVHERYHTGEKSHLCVICGRGFSRAYNLTVHMRTHTGEKPYKCQYCDSAFAQGNDLKSHIRRHTGERFQCDLCPQNFIMGYELIQHKRKIHGLNITSRIRRIKSSADVNPDGPKPETVKLPPPTIPCPVNTNQDETGLMFQP